MAVQVIVEKETGAIESPTLPVIAYDDGTPPAFLSSTDAIAAVDAAVGVAIPAAMFGLGLDGNPGIRRLSRSAFQFQLNYRSTTHKPPKPPQVGERRPGFNFHAPRLWVHYAPEVDRFPAGSPPTGAPPSHDLVNQVLDANGNMAQSGIWIEPPPANITDSLSVPPGTVTGSWARSVASMMGMVNSTSLSGGAYAPGEVCLVSVVGSLVSKEVFTIDFGWNWTANVSSETRDEVTGVAYNGQDHVWNRNLSSVDRALHQIVSKIAYVYVHQVRPYGDLSAVGFEPP